MTMKLKLAFAALTLALAGTAAPAMAQTGAGGAVKTQHGAWGVVCETPPGAPGEVCALRQDVVAADRPEMGLSIGAFKTTDGKAHILRVLAPLGIVLPPRLGLYVDSKDIGRLEFSRCLPEGCYAEALLDGLVKLDGKDVPLIDVLSTGKTAIFYVFPTPEEGIAFDVDLNGFGEGFKSLP